MQKDFKLWLENKYPEKKTVGNRISNCKKVNNFYDLDKYFEKGKYEELIDLLTYSTEDERNNLPPKHNIPIDGDIRTGTATLKQAVKLYREFKLDEEFYKNKTIEKIVSSSDSELKTTLLEILSHFEFEEKLHKGTGNTLQEDLTNFLSEKLSDFNWIQEYRPSDLCRDSIDIFGVSENSNLKVVIEIDTHRADQVAKKFLSRLALFLEDDIIYLSICYPGTDKMNKRECSKYFNYCDTICEFISENTSKDKQYIGYFLV